MKVFLGEGKKKPRHVGSIQQDDDGFRYYPKGGKDGGDPFKTLAECKQSLEAE